MRLRVSMTHKATVERAGRVLGGYVRSGGLTKAGRPMWVMQLSKPLELRAALKRIRPWSVAKAKEIDVMLVFLARARKRGTKYSPREIAQREKLYWKLRRLKREAE